MHGELATALCIYTMNLYELLEKYRWDAVKSYHFEFHRKRVARGNRIYEPRDWCQLDSELVASKCFAHPVPRSTCATSLKQVHPQSQRRYELAIRKSTSGSVYPYSGAAESTCFPSIESRIASHQPWFTLARTPTLGSSFPLGTAPPCLNLNYRKCRLAQCRYQYSCISYGKSDKAFQCTIGNKGLSQLSRNGTYGR